MAKDSDIDPKDPKAGTKRGRGIPQASGKKQSMMGDLSAEKQGLPSFAKQKQQGRPSADDDLEGEEERNEPEPRSGKKARKAPMPEPEAEVPVAAQEEIRDPSLARRTTEDVAAEEAEGPSGNEQEEELRRQAGRPKSVRAADFEPAAWESSKTRIDRSDFGGEEEGSDDAQTGSLAACGKVVSSRLANFCSRMNVFEMASVAAFLVVAVIGLFFFRNLVHSGPEPIEDKAQLLADVALPAQGELLTLSSIDAEWRDVQEGDLVRPEQLIIPEVNVTFGGGDGYLRVLFRDEHGKIRGDTFTEKVTGGKVDGSASFKAICSEGYMNVMKLVEVQAGRLEPWTVEIFETREYDVPLEQWNLLAGFDMPSKPTGNDTPS